MDFAFVLKINCWPCLPFYIKAASYLKSRQAGPIRGPCPLVLTTPGYPPGVIQIGPFQGSA